MVSTVKTTKGNYIVVLDGSVASAVINVSEKLGTKFEFTDSEAMTLRKVDAAEPDTELRGAYFAYIEETYELGAGGKLTYKSASPKEPKEGEQSESADGFEWDKRDSSTAFSVLKIRNFNPNYGFGGNKNARIYRITETIAPFGYALPENDILLGCYADRTNKRTYFKTEVPRGTKPETLPIDENFNLKADRGGWTEIDLSTPEGRTLTVADTVNELHLQVGKIDSVTNAYVAGATLELWEENGKKAIQSIDTAKELTLITEAGGKAMNIQPGVYYLVETEVPENYKTDEKDQKHYFTVLSDLSIVKGIVREMNSSDNEKHDIAQIYVKVEDKTADPYDVTLKVFFEDGTTKEITKTVNPADADAQYNSFMIFHMDQAEPKGKLKNVIGYTASSTADYEVEIAAGTEVRGQWKDIKSRCGKIPVGQTVGFGDTGVANVVELDGSNDNVLNIDRAPGAATLTIANQQEAVKSKLIFSKQDDGYKLSSVTEDTYTAVRDGKKITGAKLRLTYQGNDTTLAAVTSNLDGKTGAD